MAMIAEFLVMQLLVLTSLLTAYAVFGRGGTTKAQEPVRVRPSLRVVTRPAAVHPPLRA